VRPPHRERTPMRPRRVGPGVASRRRLGGRPPRPSAAGRPGIPPRPARLCEGSKELPSWRKPDRASSRRCRRRSSGLRTPTDRQSNRAIDRATERQIDRATTNDRRPDRVRSAPGPGIRANPGEPGRTRMTVDCVHAPPGASGGGIEPNSSGFRESTSERRRAKFDERDSTSESRRAKVDERKSTSESRRAKVDETDRSV